MKASVLDLRYRTKDILKAVERGETVTVLYRGREKARILPIKQTGPETPLSRDEAFGLWKDRRDLRDVPGYVRKLRQGRFHDL